MEISTIKLDTLTKSNKDPKTGRILPGGDPINGFTKTNRPKNNKLGNVDLTTKLRNILLDTLMEKDGSGNEMIVNAITQCIGNKPEQLLALATRLLPKDININDEKKQFAPLVVVQNNNTTNIQVTEKEKILIPNGHKNPTGISGNLNKETVDAISFSKPVLISDVIETKVTIGSFTKEDFINAGT